MIPIARTGAHTARLDAKGHIGRRHEAKVRFPRVVDEDAMELHEWEVAAEGLQRREHVEAVWGDLRVRERAGTNYLK